MVGGGFTVVACVAARDDGDETRNEGTNAVRTYVDPHGTREASRESQRSSALACVLQPVVLPWSNRPG